jgi:hypothetical protein
MTSQRSVVFAEPVRTAIGTFGGSLKDVPAPTLGVKPLLSDEHLSVDGTLIEAIARTSTFDSGCSAT